MRSLPNSQPEIHASPENEDSLDAGDNTYCFARAKRTPFPMAVQSYNVCSDPVAAGIYEQSHKMQIISLKRLSPDSALKCSNTQPVSLLCMHYASAGGGFLFAGAPFLKNGLSALTIILRSSP
jgi:hypothetical protein